MILWVALNVIYRSVLGGKLSNVDVDVAMKTSHYLNKTSESQIPTLQVLPLRLAQMW